MFFGGFSLLITLLLVVRDLTAILGTPGRSLIIEILIILRIVQITTDQICGGALFLQFFEFSLLNRKGLLDREGSLTPLVVMVELVLVRNQK
jgi:hypothetical protein